MADILQVIVRRIEELERMIQRTATTEFTTTGSSHPAASLGVGSDAALSLVGATQVFTLADVLTPAEHTAIGDGAPHHAAVTLAASATPILGLATQDLSFDTQAAATVLVGPATGAAAAPTFNVLTDNYIDPGNAAVLTPMYFLSLIGAHRLPIPELFAFCDDGDCYSLQQGIWVQRTTTLGIVLVAAMERATRTIWWSLGEGTVSKSTLTTAIDWPAATNYDLRTLGGLSANYHVKAIATGKITAADLSVLLASTDSNEFGYIARTYDGGANWNFYQFTAGGSAPDGFNPLCLDYYIDDSGIFVGGDIVSSLKGRAVRLTWATGDAAPSAEASIWTNASGSTQVYQVLTDVTTSATLWLCAESFYKSTNAVAGAPPTFTEIVSAPAALTYPRVVFLPGGSGSRGLIAGASNSTIFAYNGVTTNSVKQMTQTTANVWLCPTGNPNVEPVPDPQSGLFAACFGSRPAIGGTAWTLVGGWDFDPTALPASKSVTALAWGHYQGGRT